MIMKLIIVLQKINYIKTRAFDCPTTVVVWQNNRKGMKLTKCGGGGERQTKQFSIYIVTNFCTALQLNPLATSSYKRIYFDISFSLSFFPPILSFLYPVLLPALLSFFRTKFWLVIFPGKGKIFIGNH